MARKRIGMTLHSIGIVSTNTYGPQDPIAPEAFYRSQSRPNIDWEELVPEGENPLGVTAQTANGTAHDEGNGWNDSSWNNRANGKFSRKVNWGKYGNRTGE